MSPIPRAVLEVARGRHGLVTADELRAVRFTGRARQAALEAGVLVPVHRGVYRIGGVPESFEQRCAAALLAAPHAVLSGPTAGRIWGFRKVFTDDVHLLSHRSVRLDGLNGHQTDLLGAHDVQEVRGLRVLRPARLLCDLAWHLDDASLESVFEQMIDRGLLSVPSARAAAKRFSSRGRPGSTRLARVLDGRPAWLRPADSDLELRLWRALGVAGLTLSRQVEVRLDSGATVHIDLGDPSIRFGIEVDHVTWHGGRLDAQRDKRRDRELARIGWTIVRVTDDDVVNRLAATVAELLEIVARRSGV